jgi:hypothetical protein
MCPKLCGPTFVTLTRRLVADLGAGSGMGPPPDMSRARRKGCSPLNM